MARRIIRHEPTEAQWNVIDSLSDPYVSARGSENGEALQVYEIVEDSENSEVNLYTIQPNGEYIIESLEYIIESLVGLYNGWETRVPGEDED